MKALRLLTIHLQLNARLIDQVPIQNDLPTRSRLWTDGGD